MHHTFDIGIATKYDTSVAIFLNNLAFWVQKNMGNEKHFYEGRYWTYNSLEALTVIFPYWTARQIRTVIQKCLKHDLILIGNFNKQGYDRTQWFTLTDSGLALFPLICQNGHMSPSLICQNGQMDVAEMSNGFDESVTPIPDTKTQIENTSTSSSVISDFHDAWILSVKHEVGDKRDDEELLNQFKFSIDSVSDKMTFTPAFKARIKWLREGCFDVPIGYGDKTQKEAKLNGESLLSEYREYCGRIKADIGLKLIDPQTKPLNFEDWELQQAKKYKE